MAGEATPLDALVAEMLGDIGKLHDAVGLLTGTINEAGANIQVTINQLEAAGEKYNQAVLAANLRSKNERLLTLKPYRPPALQKPLRNNEKSFKSYSAKRLARRSLP